MTMELNLLVLSISFWFPILEPATSFSSQHLIILYFMYLHTTGLVNDSIQYFNERWPPVYSYAFVAEIVSPIVFYYNDNDNENEKVFYSTLIAHFILHITVK